MTLQYKVWREDKYMGIIRVWQQYRIFYHWKDLERVAILTAMDSFGAWVDDGERGFRHAEFEVQCIGE